MLTPEKIEELQGLLAKATLGPWSTHLVDDTTIMSPAREVATTCDSSQTDREDGYDIEYEQMEADAALIVAMRNALPALLDRLEKAEGELAEAREDVRSLCRFILNEWGPDGALKATTFALEQRQSAKGGDANAAPDRDTNSKSATSPGVTAGASTLEAAETHSAALARALEEAKEALMPFAHAAEYLEAETEGFVDDDPLTLTYRNEEACATDIGTVLQFGHFRRARSLLAPKEDTNA